MVNKFVSKLEDVSTEYHLERVGHSGDPMFIPLLDDELLIIGRDICCSPHVSRKHASFEKSLEGIWFVKDLGSMNGVYRNKKKILPNCLSSLQAGDSIGLGVPECEDQDEYLFILQRNNNLTQCVNNSSESAATAAEVIPVPNGIRQALGDLESQTKQDPLARDSGRESSPEILELFSNNKTIKRESQTPVTCLDSSSKNNDVKLNEGESSNNCINVTSSRNTNAEKTASLPLEQNLSNDESDIEIIGEAKVIPNFKSKLELDVKKPPKKNNIISHYFKNKTPQLPLTDTNPEPQASCSRDCVETNKVSLKKSQPGPLSKKKTIVVKESTKPISRPELGPNSISLKIKTDAVIRNNIENAPKEERDIEPPTINGKINKPPRPSSISLQIPSDPVIGNNIENPPMKEDCDVEVPFVNVKIHKPLEKKLSMKKLKKEALTKKCSVSVERLDTSLTKASSLKRKSNTSLSRIANLNKKYRKYEKIKLENKNKRKGRVQVLETSSESEEEFLPPLDLKQGENDELDFEKMLSTTDDADRENMTYSQMDDFILLDEDDLQKSWPKPIKIEPITDDQIIFEDYDNDMNFLPEDDVVENILRESGNYDALQEDDDDVDKLRINGANNLNFDPNDDAEPFFPELSQAFYEGASDEDLAIPSTSEIKKQPKKNAPIQLIEPLALPPKWLKKSSHPELDTNRFYQKRKDKVSPPVPRLGAKNKQKKKIDLKSKVQAEMGHRIPCPGGGSAIRPEPRNIPQLVKVVTNHAEPNRKLSGSKRKLSTDTNESPAPESVESVKKTKAKITTTSRSDKMIAEEIKSKFSKPLSGFKIPKKPPASKLLPQATTSTSTEVPNVEKPVLPNGYARRPPKTFPPNTNKRINKPQDIVSTVQIPEVAQPTLPKSKIRFAHIEDEFEHTTPIPSINGSAQVAERPRINNLPKSNLKQSTQIPSAVTPSVSITPTHGYTVDKFLALVLKWNVKWLHEQELVPEPPPIFVISKFYRSVATHYESINDHFKTYFPLIVLETWSMIFRDWKEKKHTFKNFDSPSFVTTHLNEGIGFGEMVLECVVEKKHLVHLSHYKEGMLIIFDMRAKSKNKELKFTPTFGYIKEFKCTLFNVMSNQNAQLSAMPASRKPEAQRISLFVRIASRRGVSPKWDKMIFVQPITYLRPTVRQVETLTNLHNTPLAKYILTPHTSAMTVSVFPQDRFEPVGQYNSYQKNAILGAGYAGLLPESTPKVVLLQGPPGTGKTHTCIGLIQQLLYGPSNQNSERRLLVLTPSNAAIDEITRRLIKLKPNIDANHPNSPPLNFIRVGQPDSIHSDIRAYSLDEIALTTSRQSDRKTEEELNMQTNSLQAKINSLDTVIISKLSNKLDVVYEQSKIAQLHAEMKKVDGRKVKLNAVKTLQTKSFTANAKKKLITNASVILTTLTSCRQSIIDHVFGPGAKPLKFTACIVDEASQCCEPDLLLPLQYQITKLILIGDPKQLPATVLSQKAASFNFQRSLFERFYDYYQNRESPIVMLKEQYRMHSGICSFPSKYFYNDALYTSPCTDKQLTNFPLKPYVVLDLEDSKESNQKNSSFENDKEATVIQNLCQEIIKIVPEHCSIGVITPYQGQRRLFIKNFPSNTLRRFEFNTVDGFQGREKDVIILSCVRANNEQAIGFLKCPQRLNVAITRACKSLIICGHLDSLVNHNHWRSLIEDAKSRKLIFKINSTDNINRILSFVTKK